MKQSQRIEVIGSIRLAVQEGFKRIEQFEKENEYGLPHTAVREQLNNWFRLLETLKNTHAFHYAYYSDIVDLIREKKKTQSWIGYL